MECLKHLRIIGQICEFRKSYFGNELSAAPKDKERKAKTVQFLQDCYNPITKQFHFRIMRIDGEEFDEVCEGAYLVALGKHGNMKVNQVPFNKRLSPTDAIDNNAYYNTHCSTTSRSQSLGKILKGKS